MLNNLITFVIVDSGIERVIETSAVVLISLMHNFIVNFLISMFTYFFEPVIMIRKSHCNFNLIKQI